MKGFCQATPSFKLHLNKRIIEILIKESSMHYDRTCKEASLQGGFLYGWNNILKFSGSDDNGCFATHRELDLTTKVLEVTGLNDEWTESDKELIKEYEKLVHNLITASYKLSEINVECSGK